MMKFIDNLLNKVTMYRLVLYALLFMLAAAGVLGALGIMAYSPLSIAYSTAVIFALSWLTNRIFAALFNAPSNFESTWLTALILALIITPPANWFDMQYLTLVFWASTWAIASKYIFAIGKKHLFNPAAFGVAVTGLILGLSASWWVGTPVMVPFVLIAGLLIVRKIRRSDLWWTFMITFLVGDLYYILTNGKDMLNTLNQSIFYAPILFFSTVMLTEPMTTPPTRFLRVIYGALVGFLFLPNVHIGIVYLTPELALILGNMFVYLVSPKSKLVLKLKEKKQLSPDVYEFSFTSEKKLSFSPGQYMEWTLPHEHPDARGLRRFFTIASAPTERDMKLGIKFYEPSSTYKKKLLAMQAGDMIVASQLAGDFTLPRNINRKLVFIAGGIGSTPFRSMVSNLLDRHEKRPVTLIYQNKAPVDAVYGDVFNRAVQELGMTYFPIYQLLDASIIRQAVPRYMESTFYISGPQAMVTAYKNLLQSMGVVHSHIKTDYFPGF